MNKNTMYIVVAVLVVVIIAGVAAAYYLNNGGNGGTTNPTPTPIPSGIADATTLTFSANVTSQGQTTEYKWSGKDIQGNMTIRADFAGYSYLLNTSQEKSWSSTNNGATWTASTDFVGDWTAWGGQWSNYADNLTHWNGSDAQYSYTNSAGEAIVLFNIVVNPTIPDSTFTAT